MSQYPYNRKEVANLLAIFLNLLGQLKYYNPSQKNANGEAPLCDHTPCTENYYFNFGVINRAGPTFSPLLFYKTGTTLKQAHSF